MCVPSRKPQVRGPRRRGPFFPPCLAQPTTGSNRLGPAPAAGSRLDIKQWKRKFEVRSTSAPHLRHPRSGRGDEIDVAPRQLPTSASRQTRRGEAAHRRRYHQLVLLRPPWD
ncbi:hypothetical protein VFPFJ_02829 [Purpureocillium lilacinum]|uniref:Uncharacterized protein n=1 Tax=Purpureocillium lilacinum TaxID=33203 RepID=A0A179HTH2_PURLI|nr:hypothetical protein VFPFJ_02829 [Purpureocillium lilacinum]OAQ78590.1 hypothetical protein VFPBJ_06711 [Purpureocillium lilacinum]OAQ93667.1 hypothetical protein VFPFJ_02829 [Purpureocillium lilacinum]